MRVDHADGMVLESLSFEGRGEPSNPGKPMVLSCGGIYLPRRVIPSRLKNWRQIINLPGSELSAKIFGFNPDAASPLENLLRKDFLN